MNTNLPFDLGKTYFDGRTVDTAVAAQLGFVGQCYWVLTGLSGKTKSRVRVVKNGSGVTLKAGNPVQLNGNKTQITGLAAAFNGKCGVVDYGLNSSGVPANDYCYVCEEGPWRDRTPDAMTTAQERADGTPLTAKTLAASTNATSAGLVGRTTAPTDATHAMQIIDGTVARAISACTSGETATLKNIYLDVKWS
jgi:hypothetical protein